MLGAPYNFVFGELCKGLRRNMTATLSSSLEDYLKAIYRISSTKQAARAKDISTRLGVTNSSVTGALRTLAERGLVNYAPYDLITLTPDGEVAARDVIRRQETLRDFFVKVLSVDPKTAEIGACKMEHEIPPAIVERFIQFLDFVDVCPRAGADWIRDFGFHCRERSHEDCVQCVNSCLAGMTGKQHGEPGEARMVLSHLKVGQRARLVKVGGRGELHKHLVDMGLAPGAVVGIERIAPLGDHIDIKFRGYHLSLRKEEAALITVDAIDSLPESGGA
jgi:DtxR family transcriptional regulator, Mn-dependent transcriptional regulator